MGSHTWQNVNNLEPPREGLIRQEIISYEEDKKRYDYYKKSNQTLL